MAEITTKRRTPAPHIIRTGDNFLDLCVYCWRDAFDLAEAGDEQSKIELINYFGVPLLFNLYVCRAITWDPSTVTMQTLMEVC